MENKIDIIYNYVYNINSDFNYSTTDIILSKINIDTIKFTVENSSELIKEFFDPECKIKLNLNCECYDLPVSLNIYFKSLPTLVKVDFYKNKKDITNINSPINNESYFSYILSILVLHHKIKHILLPICNIDMKFEEIEKIFNNKILCNSIKEGIYTNKYSDIGCLQIRENYFNFITLDNYLNENISWEALLFQVIISLAIIQREYPGFSHNNLFLKNIYVNKNAESVNTYEYNDSKYTISDNRFDIKIANFELATLTNKNDYSTFCSDLLLCIENKNIKCPQSIHNHIMKHIENNSKKSIMDIISDPIFNKFKYMKGGADVITDIPEDIPKNEEIKVVEKIVEKKVVEVEYIEVPKKEDTKVVEDIVESTENITDDSSDDTPKNTPKNVKEDIKENKKHKKKTRQEIDKEISEELDKIMSEEEDPFNLLGYSTKLKDTNFKGFGKQNKMFNSRLFSKDNIMSKSNIRKLKQFGGDPPIDNKPEIQPYKRTINTPFASNDAKSTFKKRSLEENKREPPILLEQKVYDTSKAPQQKPINPPAFIPAYDEDGFLQNQLLPYNKMANQPSVHKVYNISLANPVGDHTTINRVFEDILPGDKVDFSALTIYERTQLCEFFRNNLIENTDGEEMNITGGKKSLLSYIKLMEINPYIINKNPYLNMAKGFLIYRAAYPIRLDESSKVITIAKTSMGLNIRIYNLSLGAMNCRMINNNIDIDDFDVWREVKYYDWLRNNIIKRKVSPNFISSILYKIDTQSNIDWNKLEMIKQNRLPFDKLSLLKDNENTINNKHKIKMISASSLFNIGLSNRGFKIIVPTKETWEKLKQELTDSINSKLISDTFKAHLHNMIDPSSDMLYTKTNIDSLTLNDLYAIVKIANTSNYEDGIKEIKKLLDPTIDLTISSNKLLILVTEAPTSNLLQWSSKYYEPYGTVKKMVSTGYHSPEVWKSVLFQIVYCFSILQESYVSMCNMSIENNFYIKDLFCDMNNVGSWVYKVNNIDYYVPNYGYLFVFDSKYADITKTDKNMVYKINSPLYSKNNTNYTNLKAEIYQEILEQFRNIIDPDNFTFILRQKGGNIPDQSTLDLLKKLHSHLSVTKNIRDLILEFFMEYVHSRVGSLLTVSEKENVNTLIRPNFIKGNLMVYQKRYEEYEWVVFVGDSSDGRKKRIITSVNNNYQILEVFIYSLYGYPVDEPILTINRKNKNFNQNDIYETYNIDNLLKI